MVLMEAFVSGILSWFMNARSAHKGGVVAMSGVCRPVHRKRGRVRSSAKKKEENPSQCSEEGREPVPVHRRRERTRPHAQKKGREPMQCSARVV